MTRDNPQCAALPRLPATDRNDPAASPAVSSSIGSYRGFRMPPSPAVGGRRIVVGGGFRLPMITRHA